MIESKFCNENNELNCVLQADVYSLTQFFYKAT